MIFVMKTKNIQITVLIDLAKLYIDAARFTYAKRNVFTV